MWFLISALIGPTTMKCQPVETMLVQQHEDSVSIWKYEK